MCRSVQGVLVIAAPGFSMMCGLGRRSAPSSDKGCLFSKSITFRENSSGGNFSLSNFRACSSRRRRIARSAHMASITFFFVASSRVSPSCMGQEGEPGTSTAPPPRVGIGLSALPSGPVTKMEVPGLQHISTGADTRKALSKTGISFSPIFRRRTWYQRDSSSDLTFVLYTRSVNSSGPLVPTTSASAEGTKTARFVVVGGIGDGSFFPQAENPVRIKLAMPSILR